MNPDLGSRLANNWWALALRGGVAILFGLIALFMPDVTLTTLMLLFAAYMLLGGILADAYGLMATFYFLAATIVIANFFIFLIPPAAGKVAAE